MIEIIEKSKELNKKELYNIWRYLPQYWERIKELQSKIDRPMKKFQNKQYGFYGNVFDMEKVFKESEGKQCTQ